MEKSVIILFYIMVKHFMFYNLDEKRILDETNKIYMILEKKGGKKIKNTLNGACKDCLDKALLALFNF